MRGMVCVNFYSLVELILFYFSIGENSNYLYAMILVLFSSLLDIYVSMTAGM